MPVTLDLRLRIRIQGDIAMGPGKADLLEAIQATGSISAAARQLGMSYRRAWQLVEVMNRCFCEPLVTTTRGGAGRGGAAVTPPGLVALGRFRAMEAAALGALHRFIPPFEELLIQTEGH